MDAWRFTRSGSLRLEHASGRFFTVEGARFRIATTGETWDQPILNQPEVGLLGFLSTLFDGVVHFLVQAKWEPGNSAVQLSPTVQATRSNYTQAHGGRVQPYIEHFANPPPDTVLFDALMPEHGRFFLRKFNRNVVVSVDPNIELYDNFAWATLGQLKALLALDDVVHMDTRSVIACLPIVGAELGQSGAPGAPELDSFGHAIARSAADETPCAETALLRDATIGIETLPLDGIAGWSIGADSIHAVANPRAEFSIVAVHVMAGAREVAEWTQPMIEPLRSGFLGLLCSEIDGVMHFLVESQSDPGYGGEAQLFPSVMSDDPAKTPLAELFGSGAQTRFDARSSEEGGRFFHHEHRMRIVQVPRGSTVAASDAHRWLTLGQLCRLGKSGRVAMELRNVLACVPLRSV